MATFENFFPKILKSEGSAYTNHPADKGGPTKYGVTLRTWQAYGYDKDGDGKITANDIKLLNEDDAKRVAKKLFWDIFDADYIINQSIAELVVDWGWGSGPAIVFTKLRALLGLAAGTRVKANHINKADAGALFEKLKQARINYIKAIVKNNPGQKVFYNGWMNRVAAFNYIANNPGTAVAGLVFFLCCVYGLNRYQKDHKFSSRVNKVLNIT